MPFKAGDVFLAQLPDQSSVPHLCVALTDEEGFPASVFVVPVMTPKPHSDRMVMLPVSACPEFLQYESCVVFADFRKREISKLQTLVIKRYSPLSKTLLDKVIDGVFKSKYTMRGERQRFKERRNEVNG